MRVDDKQLTELIHESQDVHSGAMRATRAALDEIVELGHQTRARGAVADPERRGYIKKALFAAGVVGAGFGSTFLRNSFTHVFAAGTDVDALQTSAAIENLAVTVYTKAAGLPPAVSGAANPVVLKFVQTTITQHTEHANAFNAAVAMLNGSKQTGIDQTVYNAVVVPALPKITGPADVLTLAITLEDAAAQSYVAFAGVADDANAVKTWASIAPVEAQHVAILTAVKALLAGGAPQLVAIPTDVGQLPAAAGSVGFPNSFEPTTNARPASEATAK